MSLIRYWLRNLFFVPSPLSNQQRRMDMDWPLVCCAMALMGLGLVMSASASPYVALANNYAPLHFFNRHLAYLLIGAVLIFMVLRLPMHFWLNYSWHLLGVALLLLILVYLPVIGLEVKGSRRWVNFIVFRLQASEVAKLALVVFIAGYLVRHHEELKAKLMGFLKPMMFVVLFAVLVLFEPDFGALTVMVGSILVMLFLAGTSGRVATILACVGVPLAYFAFKAEDYRMERFKVMLDPWSDPFDKGYQITQALISFGRGDWFGLGLGNGIQKLFFLPEAHTDFVYSVIVEEFGLVGAVLTLLVFVFVCWRMFRIGIQAESQKEYFNAFVAYGIGAIWFGQVFINIAVNVSLLPTKGLTLPFISYGGSSMLLCCVQLAIVLRVEWETRQKQLREQAGAVAVVGRQEPFIGGLGVSHER